MPFGTGLLVGPVYDRSMRSRIAPARAAAVGIAILVSACEAGAGPRVTPSPVTTPLATPSADAVMPSASPSTGPVVAADLAVIAEREVDLGGMASAILSVSPDGASLVGQTPEGPCIFDAATLAERACLAPDGIPARIAIGSISWSPDGRRLAYTEDVFRLLQESDVWVMSVESGEVRNLTDDGETGRPGDASVLDFSPGWSADGAAVVFGRSTMGGSSTEVWSVPAEGSEAPSRLGVMVGRAGAMYYGTRATERGVHGSIVFGPAGADLRGVYLLPPGAAASRIVEPPPNLTIGVILGVAVDGLVLIELQGPTGEIAAGLGDPETGDVSLLGPLQGQRPTVSWAALSPDGRKIAFIRDELGTYSVVVRDLPSGPDNPVFTLEHRPAGAPETGAVLFWDQQDRLFVNTERNAGVFLTLGAD